MHKFDNSRPFEDDFDDFIDGSLAGRILVGLLGAGITLAFGINQFVNESVKIHTRTGSMKINGTDAKLWAVAVMSLALFLHFHLIWRSRWLLINVFGLILKWIVALAGVACAVIFIGRFWVSIFKI